MNIGPVTCAFINSYSICDNIYKILKLHLATDIQFFELTIRNFNFSLNIVIATAL